jgi:hypothetical protein
MQMPDTYHEMNNEEKVEGFKWIPVIGISLLMLSYFAANVYVAFTVFG